MITIRDNDTNQLHHYPGHAVWKYPTSRCPAPCCAFDHECSHPDRCPHTTHRKAGVCVISSSDTDGPFCLAWHPYGSDTTDCSCPTPDECDHYLPLAEKARGREKRAVRGQDKIRAFEAKLARKEEPKPVKRGIEHQHVEGRI